MTQKEDILSCQDISFSAEWAGRRQERLAAVLGVVLVRRIVALALYLLGAKRSAVAELVGVPTESLRTLLRRLLADGLPALQDRRRSPKLAAAPEQAGVKMIVGEEEVRVSLGKTGELRVPQGNRIQLRTVLLTLWNAGLIPTGEVACQLGITCTHVRNLGRRLCEEDAGALLDHRRGQKEDYRITPDVKGELITQVAAHAMSGEGMSSAAITASLNDRRGWRLAERTVRLHMQKLGLARIGAQLPKLVEGIKKGSRA